MSASSPASTSTASSTSQSSSSSSSDPKDPAAQKAPVRGHVPKRKAPENAIAADMTMAECQREAERRFAKMVQDANANEAKGMTSEERVQVMLDRIVASQQSQNGLVSSSDAADAEEMDDDESSSSRSSSQRGRGQHTHIGHARLALCMCVDA